eukprot:m51a1_g8467 putative protein kinase (1085) ;mRNA; r:448251-461433
MLRAPGAPAKRTWWSLQPTEAWDVHDIDTMSLQDARTALCQAMSNAAAFDMINQMNDRWIKRMHEQEERASSRQAAQAQQLMAISNAQVAVMVSRIAGKPMTIEQLWPGGAEIPSLILEGTFKTSRVEVDICLNGRWADEEAAAAPPAGDGQGQEEEGPEPAATKLPALVASAVRVVKCFVALYVERFPGGSAQAVIPGGIFFQRACVAAHERVRGRWEGDERASEMPGWRKLYDVTLAACNDLAAGPEAAAETARASCVAEMRRAFGYFAQLLCRGRLPERFSSEFFAKLGQTPGAGAAQRPRVLASASATGSAECRPQEQCQKEEYKFPLEGINLETSREYLFTKLAVLGKVDLGSDTCLMPEKDEAVCNKFPCCCLGGTKYLVKIPKNPEEAVREAAAYERLQRAGVTAVPQGAFLFKDDSGKIGVMVPVIESSLDLRAALEIAGAPSMLREKIIMASLDALQSVNEAGVYHLDLKPEHVLLTGLDSDSVRAFVIDFGYAALVGEDEWEFMERLNSRRTPFRGNYAYQSTLQSFSNPMHPASDLVSLLFVLHDIDFGLPWRGIYSRRSKLGSQYPELHAFASDKVEVESDTPARFFDSAKYSAVWKKDTPRRFSNVVRDLLRADRSLLRKTSQCSVAIAAATAAATIRKQWSQEGDKTTSEDATAAKKGVAQSTTDANAIAEDGSAKCTATLKVPNSTQDKKQGKKIVVIGSPEEYYRGPHLAKLEAATKEQNEGVFKLLRTEQSKRLEEAFCDHLKTVFLEDATITANELYNMYSRGVSKTFERDVRLDVSSDRFAEYARRFGTHIGYPVLECLAAWALHEFLGHCLSPEGAIDFAWQTYAGVAGAVHATMGGLCAWALLRASVLASLRVSATVCDLLPLQYPYPYHWAAPEVGEVMGTVRANHATFIGIEAVGVTVEHPWCRVDDLPPTRCDIVDGAAKPCKCKWACDIRCPVPPLAPGDHRVTLSNAGSVFCNVPKTLRAATAPTVTGITPTHGRTGTNVWATGSGFSDQPWCSYRDANRSCYDMYGTTIADWHNSTGVSCRIPSFRHSAQCSDVLLSISSGGYGVSSLEAFAFHFDD